MKWLAKRLQRDVFVPAFIVVVIGVSLTMWAVHQQRTGQQQRAAQRFAQEVLLGTDTVRKRINLYTEIAAGLRDLFLVNSNLDRETFERIAARHNARARYPEIRNVRFVRRVSTADKPDTDSRYIVDYLWPEVGNEALRGLDISIQAPNLEALHISRDTGAPSITAPIQLLQDDDKPIGFVLHMPIYDESVDVSQVGYVNDQDADGFIGTVGLAIDADHMLEAVANTGALQHVAVSMVDAGPLDTGHHDVALANQLNANPLADEAGLLGTYTRQRPLLSNAGLAPDTQAIQAHARRWELTFTPGQSLLSLLERNLSRWIAVAGFILTFLLATLTAIVLRQRARVIRQAKQQIDYLTYYDALTQLPNRHLLRNRLRQELRRSQQGAAWGAVLLLDIDHFKSLNDLRGHACGDQLLVQVADRLRSGVSKESVVARQGDDEFVITLPALANNKKKAVAIAVAQGQRLLDLLQKPFQLSGQAYRTTASLGVVLFQGAANQVDDLLQRADLAMQHAKLDGRNRLRLYDTRIQAEFSARASLLQEMREGLEKKEFELFYQPQIRHGRIDGAETLLRWRHSERGLISPGAFIPLAESSSLIVPLGRRVLQHACQQLALWARQPDFARLSLAVNISPVQFQHERFVDDVLDALRQAGANPRQLKLEVTESLLLQDASGTIAKMQALVAKGVSFSLDDFGTGYSSLSYLDRLPLQELKIDQSFIREVPHDANVTNITQTIITLAKMLDIDVLAEGVETEAQRSFLQQHQCHAWQGFLCSKPLPLAQFEAFMQRQEVAFGSE